MDSAVLQIRCLNTGKEDRLERSLVLFDTVVEEEVGSPGSEGQCGVSSLFPLYIACWYGR